MSGPHDPFHVEGYDAYEEGASRSENPYPEGSDGYQGWLDGWMEADEE